MIVGSYSPAFQRLIAEDDRLRALIAGSGSEETDLAAWERRRRFVAAAVNQGGTILDVRCGNGFLLRCLQEWSTHRLEPYGIDTDPARLAQVRLVFPDRVDHFVQCSAQAFAHEKSSRGGDFTAFPRHFRLIYWSVGDTIALAEPSWREVLTGLQRQLHPGGRLILGLYHPDRARNLGRIDEFMGLGHRVDAVGRNVGGGEIVLCLDRRTW